MARGTGSGNRAEVYSRGQQEGFPDRECDLRFYGWCTYLPPKYPFVDTWQIVSQWKSRGSGSPSLYMLLQDHEFSLMVERNDHKGTSRIWRAPATRGTWHSFVVEARWAPTRENGLVALWHNGSPVLPETARPNMNPDRATGGGAPNYWKLALYRSGSIPVRQTVYHAGAVVARTYAAAAACGKGRTR